MSKKIIAIGGGQIGETINGIKQPYETKRIDEEIINVSGCSKAKMLFIGLADPAYSIEYFDYFKHAFEKRYNCICRNLDFRCLSNHQIVDELFDWSNIIYVGGGNTYTLINLLKKYNIDKKLLDAYNQGKVMSGISAGGMCWFKYGNSVNPSNRKTLIKQPCLGFESLVFAPHCDEINGHFENVENLILNENLVGVSLSNCCALEIIDDKYRFISSYSDRYKVEPFGIRSFWNQNGYNIEGIEIINDFYSLSDLSKTEQLYDCEINENVKRLLKRRNIYFN